MSLLQTVLWTVFIQTDIIFLLLLLLGVYLLPKRRQAKRGQRLILISSLWFAVVTFTPLPYFLAQSLENRFPRLVRIPSDVDGIIILGGGFDRGIVATRGVPGYHETIGRLIESVKLIKGDPHIPVYFTGGGVVIPGAPAEAQLASEFFTAMGIAPERIIYEDRAKDTLENARHLAGHLKPNPQQKWVLVTSAIHMPRSVGLMRKVGFNVIPYPVDYHTKGVVTWTQPLSLTLKLRAWRAAMHEWIAMFYGVITGVSDDFFPGPQKNSL